MSEEKSRKQPFRKASIPKSKIKETPKLALVAEDVETKIIEQIYDYMLAAKKTDEIAELMNMSVSSVYSYIELGKSKNEARLASLVGTFTHLAHERIERFVIRPMIDKIEGQQKKGEFDPKAYEMLMKGIKLQADMLTSKINSVTITSNNNTFISSGSEFYNDLVDMMRNEQPKEEFIIDADDINLDDMHIPKADNLIDKINT